MSEHTSFRLGGPADLYLVPRDLADVMRITTLCLRESLPSFLLGGGTNTLVADRGIRGVVVDISGLRGCEAEGTLVSALDRDADLGGCGARAGERPDRARVCLLPAGEPRRRRVDERALLRPIR